MLRVMINPAAARRTPPTTSERCRQSFSSNTRGPCSRPPPSGHRRRTPSSGWENATGRRRTSGRLRALQPNRSQSSAACPAAALRREAPASRHGRWRPHPLPSDYQRWPAWCRAAPAWPRPPEPRSALPPLETLGLWGARGLPSPVSATLAAGVLHCNHCGYGGEGPALGFFSQAILASTNETKFSSSAILAVSRLR